MDESEDRRWKVGELAKATGLTVRTLHHYDDVGLLVPWTRTSAGHRLYAGQDVRRLYHILALRRLGLSLEEIASLLDDDVSLVETVRRHLEQVERALEHQHRLAQRLRQILDALERSVEPGVSEFIDAMEAMTVIETIVEDVMIRLPAGEADEPPPPLAREGYRYVLLKERGGERVLPICIGANEGDLLAARLGEWSHPRPMGPDLTARLLEAGGVHVERVVIGSIHGNTFYATVTVTAAGESHEVDARPSDALNLAVRVGAPVFVAPEIIDKSGVRHGVFAPRPSDAESADAGSADPPSEWRSLSPELIRSLQPREARAEWERYAEQARQVMTFAREEARAFAHGSVSPVHILLGLLREEEGLAAGVLRSLGITAERVHGQLQHIGSSDEETASGLILFVPEAQKVLKLALREEPTRHPNAVGTEHILLGLVGADEEALLEFGVQADRVREEVHRALAAAPPDES